MKRIRPAIYWCCLPILIWTFQTVLQEYHVASFTGLCEESKAATQKLFSLAKSPVFIRSKDLLKEAGKDRNEHGLIFRKDTCGNISTSAVRTSGIRNSLPVDAGLPGAFADMHNHPGNTAPSAGDLYNLIAVNKQHDLFDTRITVLDNGTVYALVIIDRKTAADFVKAYPPEQTTGFSPRFPEKLFAEFAELKSYLININSIDKTGADEMATAYILDKYSSGVALFRLTPDNRFARVFVIEENAAGTTKTYHLKLCGEVFQ